MPSLSKSRNQANAGWAPHSKLPNNLNFWNSYLHSTNDELDLTSSTTDWPGLRERLHWNPCPRPYLLGASKTTSRADPKPWRRSAGVSDELAPHPHRPFTKLIPSIVAIYNYRLGPDWVVEMGQRQYQVCISPYPRPRLGRMGRAWDIYN